ncbi:hypothetical protein [Maricaulis sp.]|uniref:hypothetical protein n=1 Tax=Maricaulis sp. TaxID=1486257 RepID=UPI001B185168|nr:hypothetical protein [Maricaulis sp.]MBO6766245.1 hypothetical protein [Maricaulis sp.]
MPQGDERLAAIPCINPESSIYEVLGEFIVDFAIMENMLRQLLLAAVEAEIQAGYFLVGRMDAGALLPKIRATLTQKRAGSDHFGKFLSDLKQVTVFRNLVVHKAPTPDHNDNSITYYNFGDTVAGPAGEKTYSAAFVRHMSYYVKCANSDLIEARSSYEAISKVGSPRNVRREFPKGPPKYSDQPCRPIPTVTPPTQYDPSQVGWHKPTTDLTEEPYRWAFRDDER